MSAAAGAVPGFQKGLKTLSVGVKLVLVCLLALGMWLPSLFVSGLVDERTSRETDVKVVVGASVGVVSDYHAVTRSLKYALLFLGLVFLTYFMFEVTTKRSVHVAQYVLVGMAQLIFYLLLLSVTEKIGFDKAFAIAGAATVLLLSVNAMWVFASRREGGRALVIFSLLYSLIYMLLRMENDALLIGSIASFAAVAAAMYVTRSIDWYGTPSPAGAVSGGSRRVAERWLE